MENVTKINKDINVVAYYFKNKGPLLNCFPKKMEWGGKSIIFTEQGLRHPTKQGHRMIHVFDMTDGQADYRIEFDAQRLTWTLVYIADQAYAPMDEKYTATNLTAATAI
jgi:hypothetical protein